MRARVAVPRGPRRPGAVPSTGGAEGPEEPPGATMPSVRAARARQPFHLRRAAGVPARGGGAVAGATAGLHVFETAARAEGLAFTSFLEGLLHGLEVERMQPGFLGAVSAVRGAAPGGGGTAD